VGPATKRIPVRSRSEQGPDRRWPGPCACARKQGGSIFARINNLTNLRAAQPPRASAPRRGRRTNKIHALTSAVGRRIEAGECALYTTPKAVRRWKNSLSPWLYRDRNAIGRTFGRLKDLCRIVRPAAPKRSGRLPRRGRLLLARLSFAIGAFVIGYVSQP